MKNRIDNQNLPLKLALRRRFLRRYHADGTARVLDCCQGDAAIWSRLRREFRLASYWGVDMKRKKGRVRVNSVRILAQPGWDQNVIDVDTYGSPWLHWLEILRHVRPPATVFLTVGAAMFGVASDALASLGLGQLKLPPGLAKKIEPLTVSYLLARACESGMIVEDAVTARPGPHVRYIGLRLVASVPAAGGVVPPAALPDDAERGRRRG